MGIPDIYWESRHIPLLWYAIQPIKYAHGFVVAISVLNRLVGCIYPHPSGLLHWHCGLYQWQWSNPETHEWNSNHNELQQSSMCMTIGMYICTKIYTLKNHALLCFSLVKIPYNTIQHVYIVNVNQGIYHPHAHSIYHHSLYNYTWYNNFHYSGDN